MSAQKDAASNHPSDSFGGERDALPVPLRGPRERGTLTPLPAKRQVVAKHDVTGLFESASQPYEQGRLRVRSRAVRQSQPVTILAVGAV